MLRTRLWETSLEFQYHPAPLPKLRRHAHFKQFADDLRSFERMYPVDHPSHLWQWALDIEDMDAEAIGFRHTSVAENLWERYEEETDETVLYDLATGDRHFEVYEYLTEFAAATLAKNSEKKSV